MCLACCTHVLSYMMKIPFICIRVVKVVLDTSFPLHRHLGILCGELGCSPCGKLNCSPHDDHVCELCDSYIVMDAFKPMKSSL